MIDSIKDINFYSFDGELMKGVKASGNLYNDRFLLINNLTIFFDPYKISSITFIEYEGKESVKIHLINEEAPYFVTISDAESR